jgi:hypothetical protein
MERRHYERSNPGATRAALDRFGPLRPIALLGARGPRDDARITDP